jgi:hypothetical protein
MGSYVSHSCTIDLIAQKNNRFAAGDAIREMVALQREFKIFTAQHSLYSSFTLLNIKASNPSEQAGWRNFLDLIRTYSSDREGVNGHDRWVQAYQENLEIEPESNVLPMHVTVHSNEDPKVRVYTEKPTILIPDDHVIVSIPVIARR